MGLAVPRDKALALVLRSSVVHVQVTDGKAPECLPFSFWILVTSCPSNFNCLQTAMEKLHGNQPVAEVSYQKYPSLIISSDVIQYMLYNRFYTIDSISKSQHLAQVAQSLLANLLQPADGRAPMYHACNLNAYHEGMLRLHTAISKFSRLVNVLEAHHISCQALASCHSLLRFHSLGHSLTHSGCMVMPPDS